MNRSLLLARERALVVEALVVEALVVEREREGGIDETRWRFARARKTARRRVAGRRRARAGRGHGR